MFTSIRPRVLSILLFVGLVSAGGSALARDGRPCENQWEHPKYGWVGYCPDWSPDGTIPVYERPSLGSRQVGWLFHTGARVNWYSCQVYGERAYLQDYYNDWWAYTISDEGNAGWVNQVYFLGGGNNEPDANLYGC
jgi:hypothetical protein